MRGAGVHHRSSPRFSLYAAGDREQINLDHHVFYNYNQTRIIAVHCIYDCFFFGALSDGLHAQRLAETCAPQHMPSTADADESVGKTELYETLLGDEYAMSCNRANTLR